MGAWLTTTPCGSHRASGSGCRSGHSGQASRSAPWPSGTSRKDCATTPTRLSISAMAEAAEYLQIPAGMVEAAVAYYGEYRDEIDREIELNEAEYERGRAAAAAGEQALRS